MRRQHTLLGRGYLLVVLQLFAGEELMFHVARTFENSILGPRVAVMSEDSHRVIVGRAGGVAKTCALNKGMFRRLPSQQALPSIPQRFGMRSREQVFRDVREVLSHLLPRDRYTFDLSSAGLIRPDLSLPAYAGFVPRDGVSPIFNFFDRIRGGTGFAATVTRNQVRDYRGGRLSYDEHDGTDFVCPPGTPVVAAAPGVFVAVRDRWLRGGLTACVDHGSGVVTQYTHLMKVTAEVGQPVQRGEIIALSGNSGFEMTQFFPWVPPHVHFMVWIRGRPVDPYLAPGESARAGMWTHLNDPRTAAGPLPGDPSPPSLRDVEALDAKLLERMTTQCLDPRVREELELVASPATRLALLEDSLHHDRPAWPVGLDAQSPRLASDAAHIRFSLPLSAEVYASAKASDTRWTRPPNGQ